LIVLVGGALIAMRLRRPVSLEHDLSSAEEMQVRALAGGGGTDQDARRAPREGRRRE